jgi:hypothetical protein
MYILRSVLVFSLLMQLGYSALAAKLDLTGTWEFKYQFDTLEEEMSTNYQMVKAAAEKNPQTAITFPDARIADEDTIKGTFYYQDSDGIAAFSPYEAIRK